MLCESEIQSVSVLMLESDTAPRAVPDNSEYPDIYMYIRLKYKIKQLK